MSRKLTLAWDVAGDGNAALFRFRWQETGGPLVTAPERKGFGSRLIERSLAGSFGEQTGIRYEPTGVVWSLKTPLAVLQETTSG